MATGYPELPAVCPQGGHCGSGGCTSTSATVTTTRSGQGVTSRCELTGPRTMWRAGESHIPSTKLIHGRLDGRPGVVPVLHWEGSGAGGSAAVSPAKPGTTNQVQPVWMAPPTHTGI